MKKQTKFTALCAALSTAFLAFSVQAKDVTVDTFTGQQTIPHNPQRVVVLEFALLDDLRELGLKDRVVGSVKGKIPSYLSEFADDKYANMGTMPEPNFEKINEVAPDLIIASGRMQKNIDRLKEIAPVLYLENDYNDYYGRLKKNIFALAKVFDKEAVAEEKLANLDKQISSLAQLTKGKTALVTIVNESRISAFGDQSRYAMVYKNFGFSPIDNNLTASTHGNSVSFEYIAEKNPDYLLVVDRTAAVTDKVNNAQMVLDNAIVNKTKAAQQHHIIYLNAQNWYLAFGGLKSTEIMVDEVSSVMKAKP